MKHQPYSRIHIIILLTVVFAVFGSTLSNGFVWDDRHVVVERVGFYREWGEVPELFTIRDKATAEDVTPYYRPFTYLTFFLDYKLWGTRPFGYHLENVLLHAAAVVLIYCLFLRLFGDRITAFFSALIFSLHPAVTEAVSFVAGGRNTTLCAVLMLSTLLVLLHRKKKGVGWTIPALLLYTLALLSKESAVAILPLLFFWKWARPSENEAGGRTERLDASILVSFAVVTVLYFIARYLVLGVFTSESGVELGAKRLALVLTSIYEYFRLMVFPLKLNASYWLGEVPLFSLKTAIAFSGIAVLLFLMARRSNPFPLGWGSAWILLGLAPVSNIIEIPSAPVAERYLYIPLIGFCLMPGFVLSKIYWKAKSVSIAALLVLSLAFGLHTFGRTRVWKDDMSLYKSMLRAEPGNPFAHGLLGIEYKNAGQLDLALFHLEEAARLKPGDYRAYGNQGNVYFLMGNYSRAIELYEKAVKLGTKNVLVHYNIALAAERIGDKDKAFKHYRIFIEMAERSGDPAYKKLLNRTKKRMN